MFENFSKMMELNGILMKLRNNHPKFPAFMNAVQKSGVGAGSVIEIRVTQPDGQEFITNVRLNEEDMECFRKLRDLQAEFQKQR